MAEAMTAEMILDAYWQLEGFWTKPRFPFKTSSGSWSDVDILAYKAEDKHLVVAESKVRGTKQQVWTYWADESGSPDFITWDKGAYLGFLDHMPTICTDGVVFRNFSQMVKKLTVQLVSNYYIPGELRPQAQAAVCSHIRQNVPEGVALEARLDETFDIICRIIVLENERNQGRRYGHPVIDMARELNRYMHPSLAYGGNKQERDAIKQSFMDKLSAALRGERFP
jgi:hypothetical protein